MNMRNVKTTIILLLLTAYIVVYKLFIFQNYMKYSEVINVAFLMILLAISIGFLGFRKDKTTVLGKNVFRITLFYLSLSFIVMYGLGLFVGFLKNAYSLNAISIFENTFPLMLIIITGELLRYVVIGANRDKKVVVIILTILLTIFELFISIRTIDFSELSAVFNITATVILPIIFKNLLMSYLAYHIGYKIPIIYRLIMDIYLFIVPIIPNLGNYINSMIMISLPVLIYIATFSMIDDRANKAEPVFNKKNFTIWDIPVAGVLIILIALISGLFPHHMIGIGSDSMSPIIKKGDAVILEKINKKTELKKGDIIAYNNGKLIIVHRIVEVHGSGTDATYTMKGDANNGTDPRTVKRDQVKGIVKIKIPIIAWPTVWLTELFNS